MSRRGPPHLGGRQRRGRDLYLCPGWAELRDAAWLLAALVLVLLVNQEMVGRLGAVTGAGRARLIYERFGVVKVA